MIFPLVRTTRIVQFRFADSEPEFGNGYFLCNPGRLCWDTGGVLIPIDEPSWSSRSAKPEDYEVATEMEFLAAVSRDPVET